MNNPGRALRLLIVIIVALVYDVQTVNAQVDAPIIVLPFEGSKPQGLRELTVELLTADGFEVIPDDQMPSLTADDSKADFSRAAQDYGALGFVTGYTSMNKKGWRTVFTVRDGSTGAVVGKSVLSSSWYKGLQKAYKTNLVSRLQELLKKCSPAKKAGSQSPRAAASKEEPKPEATVESPPEELAPEPEEEEAEEAPAADKEDAKREAQRTKKQVIDGLMLSLGPAFTLRDWTITNPVTDPREVARSGRLLGSHSAPLLGFRASLLLFPAVFFTQDSIRHIGLEVDFSRSLHGETDVANVTSDPDDELRDTGFQTIYGGLHIRIPVQSLTLGIFGGYAIDSVTLNGEKERVAVPDVEVSSVRTGLSGQLAIGEATAVRLALAYRFLLGFGEGSEQLQGRGWFPDASGSAFDFRLEVRQMFSPHFGLSLGGGMKYFMVGFNLPPTRLADAKKLGLPPPPVAGGATDLHSQVDLSAVVLLGD